MFVVVFRHIVRGQFCLIDRIGHRDAGACLSDHVDVVVVIADGDRIFKRDIQQFRQFFYPARLADTGLHDVDGPGFRMDVDQFRNLFIDEIGNLFPVSGRHKAFDMI